jgi:glycosyltransferase involved in cell wall biosynthesis
LITTKECINKNSKTKVDLVVVLPVGPECQIEFVQDTIDSIKAYTNPNRAIILIDDSDKDTCSKVDYRDSDIIILRNFENKGKMGGLYLSLSRAYAYALQNLTFKILLRMDTDTLIIEKNPEEDAIRYFEQNKNLGQIGSYKVDCNGKPRDFSWAARELFYETCSRHHFIHHPIRFMALRKTLISAMKNGYMPGEHIIGAAYFCTSECFKKLVEANLLGRPEFGASNLAEDHIMGLLVRSLGMELGDFATGDKPLGIKWRGLPDSPERLVARGKKIIHSVRFWEDMKEAEIREFFRSKRHDEGLLGS